MQPIRTIIADDHSVVREGLKALINSDERLTLAGEAATGTDALELLETCEADVAVVDISLPQITGIELVRRVSQQRPGLGIVMLTAHDNHRLVSQSLDAGARGFVLKSSASARLLDAIRGVWVGGLYVDPSVAGSMLSLRRGGLAETLTAREKDVLKRIATGFTVREIAAELALSASSVETYKARAVAKLGLKSRADIVRHALAQGWIESIC